VIKDYKDLLVWQKAMELVTAIYQATQTFPREELYGLSSQLRRAAISVPSNIAEGQGRRTRGEFRQFLGQAMSELETQILIAQNLGYLSDCSVLLEQKAEVTRLLNGLLKALNTNH
jgi:four helix bundle protein